jgi:predicted phosphodiesterase
MKNFDAILCADLHLREDQPICRTDNYWEAQEKKINFLIDLFERNYKINEKCCCFCAGDIFDKARSKKEFESIIIKKIPYKLLFSIPGNHDLPQHNIHKIWDSSIGILASSERITLFPIPLEEIHKVKYNNRTIGITHQLIHKDNPIKAEGKTISTKAKKILKDNPDCDLILSGDNHQTFVEEYQGRLLVNPGSMMRMTADQIDHKPCIFLWDAKENKVEPVYFPIEEGIITRDHIDQKEKRDERMESFIKRMDNSEIELSISFQKNMENYLRGNKIKNSVKNIIMECMDE